MFWFPVAMALASAAAALLMTRSFNRYPPKGLRVRNFRGLEVPVVGGVVLLAGLIFAEALAAIISLAASTFAGSIFAEGMPPGLIFQDGQLAVLALALGFFALGAVDDLAGAGSARGLLGHLKALSRGEITGGMVKAGGGLALAFAISPGLPAGALLDALIISLFANLINLFDLRPGRSVKVFLVCAIGLSIVPSFQRGHIPIVLALAGAALVWLPFELKEKGMLGDSGANMLGAALGAGVAYGLGNPAKLVTLGVLIALTLISEKWSYGDLIERIPPLRWFDQLGRLP